MSGYYLVKGVLDKSPYMEETVREDVMRLVVAEDAAEAKEKIKRYYEDQSRDYVVSYYIHSVVVLETIL